MAFVVEDGTGLSTATSYISEAFADTHHSDRNNTKWDDFTSIEKQAALIRATDYVDKRFSLRFIGFAQKREQALEWPRLDAFDRSGFAYSGDRAIPAELQKAIAEYALRAAICGVLAPDPILPVPKQSMESGADDDRLATQSGAVIRKKERIGPVEEETWYETAASQSSKAGARAVQSSLVDDFQIPAYPEADLWIEELLKPAFGGTLVRA